MLRKLISRIDEQLRSQKSARASNTPSSAVARELDVLALEERILYSAVPIPEAPEAPADSNLEANQESSTDSNLDQSQSELETSLANADGVAWDGEAENAVDVRHELIFLDTSVEDFQQVLDEIVASSDPSSQIEIVFVDPTRDGIEQISEALSGRNGIDAIHIVSQGNDGQFQLGNSVLNNQTLPAYSAQISSWANSLDPDADLRLYGCQAVGDDGLLLVESLTALTDCEVSEPLTALGPGAESNAELQDNLTALDEVTFSQGSSYTTHTVHVASELDLESLFVDSSIPVIEFERIELVFVDTGVEDYETLLADLQSRNLAGTLLQVALIDSQADGLAQVNQILSQLNQPFDALHFITHGTGGAFQLGSTVVDAALLNVRQSEFTSWSPWLRKNADLLLYGCDLASNQEGIELLDSLGQLTDANVAASDDLTGHDDLGGNWVLEFSIGQIDSELVFSADVMANWYGLLDLTAVGGETLVNGATTFTQSNTPETGQQVAMDSSGNYVVTWFDDRSGNSDVYAKVFNADGSVRVNELTVHAANTAAQDWTNVAMADNGNFVVTWSDLRSGLYEVYMRLFDIDGTALTGETLVSTHTGAQDHHSADFAADGSFVVAIQSATESDVYFQRYNASGVAVGGNTVANDVTGGTQILRDIVVRNDGSFIITWSDSINDGNGTGVYARMFNSSGTALANQFLVNMTTTGNQNYSSIDADASGNFVVTWTSASQDGSGDGIYMKRYNSSGTALTGDILVNTLTANDQLFSHVAMNTSGDFIVTWQDSAADLSSSGIWAQQFDSAGTRIGGQVLVNTTTTNGQTIPSVAYKGSSAVVTWTGNGVGDANGMFVQRYTTTNYSTLTVTTTSNTADGNTSSIAALLNSRGADGLISLREAILATNNSANGTGGADRIFFSIATGNQTISVTGSNLADITQALIIDGSTQTGYSGTPLISLVDGDTRTIGLTLQSGSDGSTIRGLNIQGFGTSAITILSSNNTIVGNYIGTNAAGTAAAANFDGINIWAGDNNVIGGTGANDRNVISGQTNNGIVVSGGADNTQIINNYVGLNAAGTAAIANGVYGIWAGDSVGLTIGGTSASQRNVISGNGYAGISFSNIDNSIIYGNYVGTNAAGTGDINGTGSDTSKSGIILVNGSSGNQIGNTSLVGARNVISGNNHYGVEIQGLTSTNNTVAGNFMGTDVTGLAALGNTNGGFSFWGSGTGNLLGGNVISGNLGSGVLVGNGATGSQIQGNYVGVGVDGSTRVGNGSTGIYVGSAGINTLIGTNADGTNDVAEANTVSGNLDGIVVTDAGTTGTMIYGNYIGTTANGMVTLGNTRDGIRVANGATGTLIGGTGTARRNFIAGNGQDGVHIDGEATDGNTIQNNWIGLAADGVTVLGNGGDGIYISGGADNTVIGGIGLGNVIMGARVAGIEIDGASTGTSILGNLIGINAAGTVIHGSGQSGILLENGAASTTIGGTTAGQGNTIVDSGRLSSAWQSGIGVTTTAGASNSIIGNSIYDNRGLGIDLGTTGVTANDNLDPDTGANNLQNTPVLTTATTNGSTVTVSGTLNTVASTAGILIHFYATPVTGTANTRQGRRYLGSTTVSSDASGNATFSSVALTSAVSAGELITATTTLSSSTSEFSQAIVSTASAGNSAPSNSAVTSTTDGGVTINSGSGNSTYLEVANGSSVLGGLTQFSMEFDFQAEPIVDGRQYTFASYTTLADGDAMFFGASKFGASEAIHLQINGAVTTITTADLDAIFDGNRHSISATWSQTSGAWAIYLDGVLLGSGTGLATGQTLGSGGNLVIGQDMDNGADTWQASSGGVFKGTLYDVRFFNDVRTASEVAANYRSTLPFNESGMVANWRMNDLSTAGVITDSVSGNNLTARQMTSPSFTASTPTLSLAVNENSPAGTIVGTVYGTDLDREARIASLLAADSSLRYSVETGKFYKFVNSNVTWTVAQTDAMATTLSGVSGQLATIRSAAENAIIDSISQLNSTDLWLGGTDLHVEGEFRWLSGNTPVDEFWRGNATGYAVNGAFNDFRSTEPSNSFDDRDYLQYDRTQGDWDVERAATTSRYLVEWNADEVLDATNAVTYSITSQTVSGAFAINSDSGVITVANGALLDFESQTSQTLTVRVTDGSGATFDKAFTVNINNLTESNTTPTDLSTGINLNTDGGNNAYLRSTSGGSVFGGLTALTLEIEYTMKTPSSVNNTLISYASASGSINNEVMLRIDASGSIRLSINNNPIASAAAFPQLLDGKTHAVAVSWDNTYGDVVFYVDGQLVESLTGFRAGAIVAGGGTLVIGQDQDTVDGGYDGTEQFSGTMHDIRVWNRAISSEQISQNYQQKFTDIPTGLVANWRMTELASGTTVVDSVGGVNLTVANVAVGGGFTASTPSATLSVAENATNGTSVGTVVASDANNTRDIVQDGLFREGPNPGTYTDYSAGQSFGNWTVRFGNVSYHGTETQASPLGGRTVDLNGSTAGGIYQTLSTMAGRQYQVVFAMSGHWGGGDAVKDLRVSADGASQDFSMAQPTGWSTSNMLFSNRSFTFTATDASTELDFASLDTSGSWWGPVIGDIRVIEIPAAVTTILNNDPTLSYDAATGKFYRHVDTSATWALARANATSAQVNGVSGQLVTIRSEYENNLVYELVRNGGSDAWIGATDLTVEGTWRWMSGTTDADTFWIGSSGGTLQPSQYANWNSSEPDNNGGDQDVAVMRDQDGEWNDDTASNSRHYVIEWDASEVLSNYTYSLTSNPSGAFSINANTGEITVSNASALNEIATDPTITVQVTDASGNTYSEAFTIAVARVNDNAPVITSNGGGATASINVAEGATAVTTITATDADLPAQTLTYSIVGGADSSLFSISSTTGALSFITGRNFETPADAGANNVYDIIVRVDDGANWDDQAIAVTITNIDEASTVSIPTSITATEDANIVFSAANGNAITVADPDGTPQRVTISVPTGTLTLSTVSGLTFTAGDGTADSLMTFSGSITNINAALNGLTYTLAANYNGSASIRVVSGDAAQATAIDTDANLLIRYTFDNSSQLNDDTATTANGTNSGAVTASDSTRGNFASFDGVDDVITTANFNTPSNFTIGVWAKSDTATWNHSGFLLSKRDSFVLHPHMGGTTIDMFVQSSSTGWTNAQFDLSTISGFSLTDWHHYAGSFDGTTIRLYIDGVERAAIAFSGTLQADSGGMTIGQDDGFGRFFDGRLDDARVYSRALSAPEMATLASNSSAVREQTFNISAVDDAPTSTGGAITGVEDTARVLSWSEFNVSDVDTTSGSSTAVRVLSLPADGTLQYHNGNAWVGASINQVLTKATIDAGLVRFMPDANESGHDGYGTPGVGNNLQTYAQFNFAPVQTNSITIVNPGAESNTFAEGGYGYTATGWAVSGGAGSQNPTVAGFPADHDNTLFTDASSSLTQTLGTTFSSNNNYSLSFEVGWLGLAGYVVAPEFRVELWAGATRIGYVDQTAVAMVKGELVSGTLAVDGTSFSGLNGQALQIRLVGVSSQTNFDNLSLTSFARTTELGTAATMSVDVTPVNDAPTITNLSGDSLSYSEGAGAVVIEQGGNALVADVDSADFSTGTLTVSFAAGSDSAEDRLSIRNQGTGAGQIGVGGSNVTYAGVTIGSVTGGTSGTTLVITLNSSATPTAVTELVKNITYENTDTATTTTGARTVRFVLTDGNGGTSANHDATVTVTAVNDAPAFSVGDGIVTTNIVFDEAGEDVMVQPDGKILVVGTSGSPEKMTVTRYNSDGSLDTSFGGGDGIYIVPAAVQQSGAGLTLQADGKILLTGSSYPSSQNDVLLVRLNADGSLDTSFGGGDGIVTTDLGINEVGRTVVVQADGKILIGGYTDGAGKDFLVVRYNPDGSLDTSFGGGDGVATTSFGGAADDFLTSLVVQSDGKIVVAGGGGNFDLAVVRYNSDGSLDMSFGVGGLVTTSADGPGYESFSGVVVQADGKLVAAGYAGDDMVLVRYNLDGSLDTSLGGTGIVVTSLGAGADGAGDLVLQSDGKIVLVGYTHNGSNYDVAMVRYHSDGSLDTSYGGGDGIVTTAIGSAYDEGLAVAIQADGKIVVSGKTWNGTDYDIALLRYNADGTLDTKFDLVSTLNGTPTYIEGGAEVVLDADVQIFDAELSVANNFSGATLTLARNGGASSEDAFSATGTLSALTQGGNLVVGGTTIGTVTTNSAGTLVLTFNANATNTLVNSVMHQIAYSNNSDTPPTSAQINWTFNDGNTGSQGSGGALTATGSVVVNITAVNDAPSIGSLPNGVASTTVSGGQGSAVATGDFDGDGDVDVIRGTLGGEILLHTNNGSGSLSAAVTLATLGGEVQDFEVADLDGDGDLDIAAVTYTHLTNPSVHILTNDGTGTFTVTSIETVSTGADSIAVGDIDGDGDLDLAASFWFSGDVAWYEYVSPANYVKHVIATPGGLISVNVADLDSDGDADITATSRDLHQVLWYENIGGGSSFSQHVALNISNAFSSVTADFDGDGDIDIAYNSLFGVIGWLENSGGASPTFTDHRFAGTYGLVWQMSATDIDGDGDSDLLAADSNANDLILFRNDGADLFSQVIVDGSYSGARSGQAADLNGDGELELVAAGTGSGDVNVYTGVGSSGFIRIVTSEDTLVAVPGITISDVDAGSGHMQITLSSPNGQLSLSTLAGLTFTSGDGTLDGTMVFTGTIADVNAALATLTILPNSNFNGDTWIDLTVSDQGNSGSGGTLTAFERIGVRVTAMNDAPVLDGTRSPVLLSVSEHAGAPSGAVGTLVSSVIDFATPSGQVDNVTDVDASATTGIAITATNAMNGTWWYSTDNGSTWQRIGNVSTASARLLAADATTRIYFEPTQSTDFTGTISNAITFRAWDGTSGSNGGTANTTVNGGSTAFSMTTDTAAITIDNVNDAPQFLGNDLIANGDFTTNLSGWTIVGSVVNTGGRANFGYSDVVGPHSISQTISTVAGQTYQLSFDYLDGSPSHNQSLVATATGIANLLTTNHLVTDVATSNPGARFTFTFVADSSSTTITLTDTSDQSGLSSGTLSVDGLVDNVSVRQLAGQMGTVSYTENDSAVAIHSTIAITDVDDTHIESAFVVISGNYAIGQDLLSFTNQNGISGSWNAANGELTLSGSATVAQYETALRSITYTNTSDNPSSATRTVSFTVYDGGDNSNTQTRDIAFTAINDAPVVIAPAGPLSATENLWTAIDGVGFSFSDVDAGSGNLRMTLNVTQGYLTVGLGDSGVSIVSGNVTGTVVLEGNSTALNNLITSGSTGFIRYVPNIDDPNATTTLTVTVNDLGNSGTDPGLTGNSSSEEHSASVLINVTAVNDAPSFQNLDGNPTYTEGGSAVVLDSNVTISDPELNAIGHYDGATLRLVRNGGANGDDALAFDGTNVTVSGADVIVGGLTIGTYAFSGGQLDVTFNTNATQAQVNTLLQNIVYWNWSDSTPASVQINWSFNDENSGVQGTGGALIATGSTTVNIVAVNNEQVLSINSGSTVNENSIGSLISNTQLQTTDVDNSSSQLVYTITTATSNGTLRRNGTALSTSDAFTQADIDSGLISYDHGGGESGSDSFSFSVDDGAGSASTGTFNFTIAPVNDNNPIITSNGGNVTASINVAENSTAVTTVTATDADLPGQTLTYSISGVDAGLFTIDSSTGVLAFASGRNRESHSDFDSNGIYEVTVQVSDGSLTDSQAISVTITDVDEFDVTSPTDVNATANAVDENVAIGTVVGITASSSDADATTNLVSYSLFDNDGGNFAIDANNGIVTTAAALNRETLSASRNITVRATSADGSTADTVFTITINDLDEFDTGAVSDSNAAANSVAENAANGTVVGVQALAADADATTNTITYSLDDNAGGRFTIDANTGVVTVANSSLLNYEAATSHNITIRATSADTSFSTQSFTINLTDVNEGAVGAVSDADNSANYVLENATNGTTVGITGLATDTDGTDVVTYSLDDNAGGRFTIDANTGVVTVNGAIDREAAASYNITIRATSTDTSTSTQTFTINIGDIDEFNAGSVSDSDAAANSVVENATVGTTVRITGLAIDADATTNTITYSLQDNDGGRFAIDANTGIVTVAGTIDRETDGPSRSIVIRATSADGSFADQSFAINVVDANEAAIGAVSDANVAVNYILENSAIGSAIGITGLAIDPDATDVVTYSLDDSAGGLFAIDANSGVVTVNGSLDRETAASYNITIRATSTDTSTTTQSFTINIGDVDEFNVGAVTDNNALANSVVENAANGTVVNITGLATDADATNSTVAYSLDDDAGGRFTIDSSTGVVSVANGSLLDYDTVASHNITIRASSVDGSWSTQVFTINLTNANEGPSAFGDSANAVEAGGIDNTTAGTNPSGNVLSNDTDVDVGDTKTVIGVASGNVGAASGFVGTSVNGLYGSISIASDGSYAYTVDNNNATVQSLRSSAQSLSDVFTYTMVDSGGLTSTAQVSVTIQGANDAPSTASDSVSIVLGVYTAPSAFANLLSNDADVEGDALTAVLLVGPSSGSLVLNADGSWYYDAALGFYGQDSFTYAANDGVASSSPTTVTIFVSAGGPPPPPPPDPDIDPEPDPDPDLAPDPDSDLDPDPELDPDPDIVPQLDPIPGTGFVPERTTTPNAGDLNRIAQLTFAEDFSSAVALGWSEGSQRLRQNQNNSADWTFMPWKAHSQKLQILTDYSEESAKMNFIIENRDLQFSLNQFQSVEDEQQSALQLTSGMAVTLFVGASAGIASWCVGGSYLLSMLASSVPTWAGFDVIHVVNNPIRHPKENDKSVAQIIESGFVSESEASK